MQNSHTIIIWIAWMMRYDDPIHDGYAAFLTSVDPDTARTAGHKEVIQRGGKYSASYSTFRLHVSSAPSHLWLAIVYRSDNENAGTRTHLAGVFLTQQEATNFCTDFYPGWNHRIELTPLETQL